MPAPHSSADSPVMRQYLEIKGRFPDSILMFRMGDFYEMFFEDAVEVGPVLDIAVTSRDKKAEDPVPMAGVPYHAIGGYLRTLVQRGYKVAICEQLESPEQAKKRKGPNIVRREVVRVVTPGALIDDEHLKGEEANYLVAVVPAESQKGEEKGAAGVAALDISSGEFEVVQVANAEELKAELARLSPREILVPCKVHDWLKAELGPDCPRLESIESEPDKALQQRVLHLYCEGGEEQIALSRVETSAAATALAYAEHTQPGHSLLLHRLRRREVSASLCLDEASLRNLEIFRTLRDGKKVGTLLWSIDRTQTAMGSRLLRQWIGAPLRNCSQIHDRQEGVEALLAEPKVRAEVQSKLKDVRDIVRLAARARLKSINPREMGALRDSLGAVPELGEVLTSLAARRSDRSLPHLLELGRELLSDLREELERCLVDDPPTKTSEGGIIRSEADKELAEQRKLRDGGREALAEIERREREATGIPNLKVQHNRVFGYFLEVSKSHLSRVPKDYVRKQTLANAERFVTPELAQLESKVLGAQSLALVREERIFEELRELISEAGERLIELGERLATIDVLCGLASVAESQGYERPEMVEEPVLEIEEGRHPVVEQMLGSGQFVPNDTLMLGGGKGSNSQDHPRLLLVTGPNMGGKSTVMRQVALITILAHIGSYVPAKKARIGLVDRVFTRVGAADDLGRGESTFMVEMRETAQILAQAGPQSLVLLDEIGRGTATYDGLSLAWSITEHLHDQITCRTMFATHYHELCGLETQLVGVSNVHVAVHENRGRIVFLHRVEAGAAGRSYGIQVGRLAGLPTRVLRRAGRILERLERERDQEQPQLELFAPAAKRSSEYEGGVAPAGEGQLDGYASLIEELRTIDLDEMSPRQAFEQLARWKGELEDAT